MDGYVRALAHLGPYTGISKISVQTARATAGSCSPTDRSPRSSSTSMPKALSADARSKHGLGGAVQHWGFDAAADAFATSPSARRSRSTSRPIPEHRVRPPTLPADLRRELQDWVKAECKDEWKKGDTEEQFYYKSRKKAIGPFKRRMWDLPADVRAAIAADLEKTFAFLFEQLRVTGTRAITDRYVKPPLQSHAQAAPGGGGGAGRSEAGE